MPEFITNVTVHETYDVEVYIEAESAEQAQEVFDQLDSVHLQDDNKLKQGGHVVTTTITPVDFDFDQVDEFEEV